MMEETETPVLPPVAPPRRSLLATWAPVALAAIILALVPLWVGESRVMMRLALDALLFITFGVAFNLIFGSTKQLFLCVGALAGVGGYTSAILVDLVGLPLPLGIVVATAAATAIGGTFSWVAVRRSLDVIFVGIVTLTFSLAFHNLVLGLRHLTRGETGVIVVAGEGTFLRGASLYYVFLAIVVAYLVVFRLLQSSHIGWAFRALSDDEVAAELTGVNVARYRVYAGLIGSGMLGLAGAIFAHGQGFISPSTFAFGRVDVRVIVLVIFGGLGTLLGPVVGGAIFAILDEFLLDFGQVREVVYGFLLVVLFLGLRRGLIPTIMGLVDRVRPKTDP